MKVCNLPSCESCKAYGSRSFIVMKYPCGRIKTPNKDTDCMIFLLSGKLSIRSENSEEYICETDRLILLMRDTNYEINVLTEAYVVIHRFVTSYQVCEKMTIKDIKHIMDSIQYKFTSLEIKEPLKKMLKSIIDYLNDGIDCAYWQNAKNLESFVIFWHYYTIEDICLFFYPVIHKEIGFHTKVMANYEKAKTVTELADLCGYGLPTFTKLFAEHFQGYTPYQWMLQQKAPLIKAKLFDKAIPIKAIVLEFGFTDQSYFNIYCKRHFGATASQIRKGND